MALSPVSLWLLFGQGVRDAAGPGLPQPASGPECPPVWNAPCRALTPTPSCPGLPWPPTPSCPGLRGPPPRPALGSVAHSVSLVSTVCAHGGPSCLRKPGVAFLGTAWTRVQACRRDSVSPACSGGGLLTEQVSEQKPSGGPAGPGPWAPRAGGVPPTFPCPASETQGPVASPPASS